VQPQRRLHDRLVRRVGRGLHLHDDLPHLGELPRRLGVPRHLRHGAGRRVRVLPGREPPLPAVRVGLRVRHRLLPRGGRGAALHTLVRRAAALPGGLRLPLRHERGERRHGRAVPAHLGPLRLRPGERRRDPFVPARGRVRRVLRRGDLRRRAGLDRLHGAGPPRRGLQRPRRRLRRRRRRGPRRPGRGLRDHDAGGRRDLLRRMGLPWQRRLGLYGPDPRRGGLQLPGRRLRRRDGRGLHGGRRLRRPEPLRRVRPELRRHPAARDRALRHDDRRAALRRRRVRPGLRPHQRLRLRAADRRPVRPVRGRRTLPADRRALRRDDRRPALRARVHARRRGRRGLRRRLHLHRDGPRRRDREPLPARHRHLHLHAAERRRGAVVPRGERPRPLLRRRDLRRRRGLGHL